MNALLVILALSCAPALTEQDLIKQYGKANVQRGSIYVGEGFEEPGTIVFPNDEKKRIEVVWRDRKKRQKPEWIRIGTGNTSESFAGLRIGMPLPEIAKLNGRPFTMTGFDWDYGGTVTNWNGGKLEKTGAPCRVQIRFDRNVPENPTRAQQKALDATSGDREIASSDKQLRVVMPFVSEIVIQSAQ